MSALFCSGRTSDALPVSLRPEPVTSWLLVDAPLNGKRFVHGVQAIASIAPQTNMLQQCWLRHPWPILCRYLLDDRDGSLLQERNEPLRKTLKSRLAHSPGEVIRAHPQDCIRVKVYEDRKQSPINSWITPKHPWKQSHYIPSLLNYSTFISAVDLRKFPVT